MQIVVVLPTYNEAGTIDAVLRTITGRPPFPDVLVVDDSSPDGTGTIAAGFTSPSSARVHLLTRPGKQGLGAAYRAGFTEVLRRGYDVIAQMDADGSHPVEALPEMLNRINDGDDLVVGSRYCAGGAIQADWPFTRRAISRGGNLYAQWTSGCAIKDLTSGFKMWKRETLAGIDLGMADASGYAFQVQMTLAALCNGARITEIPILFTDRQVGTSKMSGKIVIEAARKVFTAGIVTRRARTGWAPLTRASLHSMHR